MLKNNLIIQHVSLKKNFVWTMLGNLIYAACQWGFIIVFVKFGSVQTVGTFALAIAITSPIYLFSNLQLRNLITTDAANKISFNVLFGLRLLTIFISVFIITGLLFFSGYKGEIIIIILLVTVNKALESILDLIYGKFQQNERMDLISRSMVIRGVSFLFTLLLMMYSTVNLVYSLVVMIMVSILIFILFEFRKVQSYTVLIPRIDWKIYISTMVTCLPLAVVALQLSLGENIPRYFIKNLIGLEFLGYYSSLYYIKLIGSVVANALGQTVLPRLSKYYYNNEKMQFYSLFNNLLIVGLILGALGIALTFYFGETLLKILYDASFASYSYILVLIMISAALDYLSFFIGYALTAARKFKVQPFIMTFGIISNILSCYFLISKYGLNGAVYSIIISSAVQLTAFIIVGIYVMNSWKGNERMIQHD